MLKAIKECLKNWLVAHERLYWYIVIGLAVFGFGLITAIGCAKLYDANAAEVTDYHANHDYKAIYETACNWVSSSSLYGAEYLEAHPYRVVVCGWGETNFYASVMFWDTPVNFGDLSSWREVTFSECLSVYVDLKTGVVSSSGNRTSIYMDIISLRYTTYDIYNGDDVVVEKTKDKIYSVEAPYVTFLRLDVVNKIAQGDTGLGTLFSDFYEDFSKTSFWRYNGVLNNMDAFADMEYWLDAEFVVELPTDSYIEKLYSDAGINTGWQHNTLKYCPEAVSIWNSNDKAPKRTFEFRYVIELEPDENGFFSYELTFAHFVHYIKYFNSDMIAVFNAYEPNALGLLLSFLHVDCVTSSIRTTREDSYLYGKITTNQFDRGIFDVCMEVIPDIDINTATPEEIDKVVNDALADAHDKYLKDLEQRLKELENQMNDIGAVGGVFSGGLESSDLWTGFQSLAEGLGSLAPSIASLSLLAGSVFAFMPSPIMTILMFTFFAVCVIAIIKAIRG